VEHLVAIGFWIFGYWHLDFIWLFYWAKPCKGPRCFKLDPTSNWFLDLGTVLLKKKLAIKKLCLIFCHIREYEYGKFKTEVLEISFYTGGRAGLPPARRISKPHVGAFHGIWGPPSQFYFFGGAKFRNAATPHQKKKKRKKKKRVHGKRVQRNFLEKILNIR